MILSVPPEAKSAAKGESSMPDPEPNWTVAVHLAGGKSLTEQMIRALQEMRDEANRRKGRFRVVAQFEMQRKLPRTFAFNLDDAQSHFALPFTPSRRRAPRPPALASYEYKLDTSQVKAEDISSLELLAKFVETGKSVSAGGPFMLVISGHGNGAVGAFLAHRDPGAELSLLDLPVVFHSAGISSENKVDILGMDCCSMSMIEVGFELSPYARFLVASEGDVPNYGWPYRQILDAIYDMAPEEAASEIVRQFVSFYFDYSLLGLSSHCSVCDLQRIDVLADPVRRLAEVLTGRIHHPAVWQPVVLAHWEAQSYKDEEYVDLADFCHRLYRYINDRDVRRECADVIAAVSGVVKDSYVTGANYQYSTGLSVYFPWCNDAAKGRGREIHTTSDLEGYKMLKFNKKTQWGDFLDAYLEATQRKPGPEPSLVADELSDETQPVRRTPPFGRGGGASSPGIKNHPSTELSDETQPVRRTPPFGRGSGASSPGIKNHPSTELSDEIQPVRRTPPFGRGSRANSARIKNHPSTD
jgi:hypothetical protein